MGTGGAPEGVLTAAAMRCLNGEIFARLVVKKPEHEERCRAMGITDFKRVYTSEDLASGDSLIFAATGVTDGALMKGVRFFGDGTARARSSCRASRTRIRFIDTIHVEGARRAEDPVLIASQPTCAAPGSATSSPSPASFIGFTGFTLVMPFLPLYLQQLGVDDVGEIALWSGLSLGVTPAVTALLAPFWGRVADRFGRKIMVERSLVSFILLMAAMAFVTAPWHVFALRAVQGLFAGYGASR